MPSPCNCLCLTLHHAQSLKSLALARERGRVGGRRRKLTPAQEAEVVRRVSSGEATAAEMARLFRVHRSSIGRLLQRHRQAAAP
jgi:hypothetical protein